MSCLLLAAVLLTVFPAPAGHALFSEDDTPDSFADLYGWDRDRIGAEEWEVTYNGDELRDTPAGEYRPDGITLTVPRSTDYAIDYYLDLVETTRQYLGLTMTAGSGAGIAALALAEYEACEEEVRQGTYGVRRETNHDNTTKYTRYWGLNAAWCAMFVSWLADQCGYMDGSVFPSHCIYRCGLGRGGYLQWFRDNGNDIYKIRDTPAFGGCVYTPLPGDVIIFGRILDGTDHIGLVTDADEDGIETVEGNVLDRVVHNRYSPANFGAWGWADAYIIHIDYPVPEGTGGMSEDEVRSLWETMAVPSKDELYTLAAQRYGYDETAVDAMLAYVEGESGGYYARYRDDPYIEYLYGCIAVNQMSLWKDGKAFRNWIISWAPNGYYSAANVRDRARRPSDETRKALYLALMNTHPDAYYGYGTGKTPPSYIYTFLDSAGDRIWIMPKDGGY